MRNDTRVKPRLEILEDRCTPAILLQLDSSGNLTGIFGVPSGDVVLTQTAANAFNVDEGLADLGTYNVPGNLAVSLGNTVAPGMDLTVNLGGFEFSGSMNLRVGNATLGYTVSVLTGTIDGNLDITTGNGPDTVLANAIVVQGSLNVNTANSFDVVSVLASTVQGNLAVRSANTFTLTNAVEGLFTFDSSRESLATTVTLTSTSTVAGIAVITTGAGTDVVNLGGAIAGHAIVNLGNGLNTLNFGTTSAATVLGNMAVISGSGNDVFNFGGVGGSTAVAGNLTVVGGNGRNQITFTNATVLGTNLTYVGGNGIDTLTVNSLTAPGARMQGIFGNGNDVVVWNTVPVLASAYLDGGFGFNTFTSLGVIDFPITLRNFT